MKGLLQEVKIKQDRFILSMEDNIHYVEYNDERYRSLSELFKAAPCLYDPRYLLELTKIANFIFRKDEFEVIEDISAYVEEYQKKAALNLSPFGNYDVTSMKNPFVFPEGKLQFFVEHRIFHIPYQVTCTYPFMGPNASFQYQLLPEKSF